MDILKTLTQINVSVLLMVILLTQQLKYVNRVQTNVIHVMAQVRFSATIAQLETFLYQELLGVLILVLRVNMGIRWQKNVFFALQHVLSVQILQVNVQLVFWQNQLDIYMNLSV